MYTTCPINYGPPVIGVPWSKVEYWYVEQSY